LYLEEIFLVTQLDVVYRYVNPPTEIELRALDNVREVYGIRKISFDEKAATVRVEFDASRLKEPVVAELLRKTGMELNERLVLA